VSGADEAYYSTLETQRFERQAASAQDNNPVQAADPTDWQSSGDQIFGRNPYAFDEPFDLLATGMAGPNGPSPRSRLTLSSGSPDGVDGPRINTISQDEYRQRLQRNIDELTNIANQLGLGSNANTTASTSSGPTLSDILNRDRTVTVTVQAMDAQAATAAYSGIDDPAYYSNTGSVPSGIASTIGEVAYGAASAVGSALYEPLAMASDTTRIVGEAMRAVATGTSMSTELEMHSALASSGLSTGEVLRDMALSPVTAPYQFGYNATTALMSSDAYGFGHALGEGALLFGGARVGGANRVEVNVGSVNNAGYYGQRGAAGPINVRVIPQGLMGNGQVLARNMGGVPSGYAAHHLIMTSLAKESPALNYLAKKGLYDVNRSPNGMALPMTESLAAESGLPLHNGGHGPRYTDAVRGYINDLNSAYKAGANDGSLLNQVARMERALQRRLLNGDLWLNKPDAMLRGLSGY
jgi:A nuclease family of the HNH/ENDO VII superfamily with conserved AHH